MQIVFRFASKSWRLSAGPVVRALTRAITTQAEPYKRKGNPGALVIRQTAARSESRMSSEQWIALSPRKPKVTSLSRLKMALLTPKAARARLDPSQSSYCTIASPYSTVDAQRARQICANS
jgi:hypothetical protein